MTPYGRRQQFPSCCDFYISFQHFPHFRALWSLLLDAEKRSQAVFAVRASNTAAIELTANVTDLVTRRPAFYERFINRNMASRYFLFPSLASVPHHDNSTKSGGRSIF